MCGIAGFIRPGGLQVETASNILRAMTDSIAHRGPDDAGQWFAADAGVALGHRRLAVVDLTEAGHQPMGSPCARYVLIFNGEIYNHRELRSELGDRQWRGHSDTETLLAAISAWGLKAALQKCVGMFALALWDAKERCLSLARDRIGEKPLYYGWNRGVFLFGSELRALRAYPDFEAAIERQALERLVRQGYVSGAPSIFKGIQRVPPGAIVALDATGEVGSPVTTTAYWSLHDAALAGARNPFAGSPEDAVTELERLVDQSVAGQMLADVHLGAFLSGGVDSSVVVSSMQRASSRRVKTFTIGFEEEQYNEADHARAVAAHIGTEHTEFFVTPEDALALVPQLPNVYDEPFADMSQIPTMMVSRLARAEVTVALSGDGGDELFWGYGRYPQALDNWAKLSRLPLWMRRGIRPLLPHGPIRYGFDKPDIQQFYRYLNTQWKHCADLVLAASPLPEEAIPPELGPVGGMVLSDMTGYLPDDIMVKVDRAAMAYSLETRAPLLDHRLVEFAWQLPGETKMRGGVGKWPLKQLLYRHVPEALVNRPKMGFGVPIADWLRTSLRDWAEALLDERRLRQQGYFNAAAVRAEWDAHLAGTDRHYGLWAILMFQAWMDSHD
ncbi:asparagine synthase (glutamine-hydrolyzing) [Sphingomonas sp. Root241]|uniref:asparagine synthase (glutamine-hydrolyzing) n=1 Tax=Sphingomonas sp. Root241 TaxID=1736501 RepID=UPI0006F99B55|nr:asparagine synthase (glutamine-hydrolyzing) [Sphingomonas sp. Root241]KRC81722.1 hypothetical protein ASE13_04930 [Sphingomonas sp. Root241]